MGAWIETKVAARSALTVLSHPTWVRGLKLRDTPEVARDIRSHPTWVRGLKPTISEYISTTIKSHPTWVRGLKHVVVAESE